MILHEVTFGPATKGQGSEARNVAESYLAALCRNGQLGGEYSLVVRQGMLAAFVNLMGPQGWKTKAHSQIGVRERAKVAAFFGHAPQWKALQDAVPTREATWAKAPHLCLFTTFFERESPVRRGDNGQPIPLYRLPVTDSDREGIRHWAGVYHDCDSLWLDCGAFELAACRQLSDPRSELAQEGLAHCRTVEKATGIRTFYFLLRYWGRPEGEENRPCPLCGKPWRTQHPIGHPGGFWDFAFQCQPCRLVSHLADGPEGHQDHAGIGEYQPPGKPA